MDPSTIALIGPCNVGKTCLVHRIKTHEWKHCQPTFSSSHSCIKIDSLEIKIWDISGSPSMRHLYDMYLGRSKVVLCCYEAGNEQSYGEMISMVKGTMVDRKSDFILCALKTDISKYINDEGFNTRDSGLFDGGCFYISSKKGTNVIELIKQIKWYVENALLQSNLNSINSLHNSVIRLEDVPRNIKIKKKNCCIVQ